MKKEELRIVFMGTPEFAVETLQSLVDNNYNVVAVVTQPDKPVGRHGSILQPSAVKQYAQSKNIPVLQPVKMKDEDFIDDLKSFNANLQIVVAFRMLPEIVWDMPKYGTFNVHASLLPQYRGAAPINWAVINGETRTGVTTFFLDHEIDTGRVIMQLPYEILDDCNVEDVYNGLMHLGSEICLKTLDKIIESDGYPVCMPQNEMGIDINTLKHAPKIFKDTCRIDWNQQNANVYNFVRGLSPCPGAWTTLVDPSGKEIVLKVFKTKKSPLSFSNKAGTIHVEQKSLFIQAKYGAIEVLELQIAGKTRMKAHDFINGFKNIEQYTVK